MPKLTTPELQAQYDAFEKAFTVAEGLVKLEKVDKLGVLSDVDLERSDVIEELGLTTSSYTRKWPAHELNDAVTTLVRKRERNPEGPVDPRLMDRVMVAFERLRKHLLDE